MNSLPTIARAHSLAILQQRSRTAAGFSLVEAMMAVLVMGLVLSSAFAAFKRTYPMLETARNVTIAGQIMQTELERLRLQDWSSISALTSGPVTVDPTFASNPAIGNRFTLQRSISTPASEMREIVLTVSWQASEGRTHERSYTIRYARYGLYDYFYNTM